MGGVVRGVTRAIGLTPDPKEQQRAASRAAREGGAAAAGAIRSQPFEIEEQVRPSKQRAERQFELAEMQQRESREASRRQRGRLEDIAEGRGPSLAEAQLRSAQDRTLAQQLAAAAAQRGGSPAALQRQLAQQQAASGQQLAQQSAEARLMEAAQARQQLGAQLAQERAAADAAVSRYLSLGFDLATAQQRAQQDLERLRTSARTGGAQIASQAFTAAQQAETGLMGGLLGAGARLGAAKLGAAAAASDKNMKENVKSAEGDIEKFLTALSAKKYNYKDPEEPGASEGIKVGIMAQDLEKSPMGKTLVVEAPNGKMVNTSEGFGALLAAQAHLHKKIGSLEKALKSKKMGGKKRG